MTAAGFACTEAEQALLSQALLLMDIWNLYQEHMPAQGSPNPPLELLFLCIGHNPVEGCLTVKDWK